MFSTQIESYRYPRAGTPNATSTLKLAEFSFEGRSETSSGQLLNVKLYHLAVPLASAYPGQCEYLVRAGWLPDGSAVWCQVTDRLQHHVAFLLLPLDAFVPDETAAAAPASVSASTSASASATAATASSSSNPSAAAADAPAPAPPAPAPAPAAEAAPEAAAAASTTATTVPKTTEAEPMEQEQSPPAPAATATANKPSCPYWILYEYELKYWGEVCRVATDTAQFHASLMHLQ